MSVEFRFVDHASAMGATLVAGGMTVRTWAPRAKNVFLLTGEALAEATADDWRPSPNDALTALGDETWGGFLSGPNDGTPYMLWVEGSGSIGPKRDPYARELTLVPAFPASHCVLRDPGTYLWHDRGWRAPDFRDLIIYQLHVGTWWAVDATGSDVRATRGGRFLDVATRLDYLRDLGVNAIQLLPVQEYATRFSAGYNGVDYFSPEGLYQVSADADLVRYLSEINNALLAFDARPLTLEQIRPGINQLKCLIDLAHLHGIAVIFDLVYNHAGGDFGDQSLWFYDRSLNGNPNNSLYFTDQDWAGGQVFAFWNAHVRQFLIDNAVFFLNEYHIDGIRYDEVRVISDNRPAGRELCQDITGTVRFTRPSAIQIAEYWDWDRASPVTSTPAGLGFDAALGDGFRDAVRALLSQAAAGETAQLQLDPVARSYQPPPGYDAAWRLVQHLENHDLTYAAHSGAARVPMLADPADRRSWYARSRSRAATVLLFAAPGIPSLFMGEEILEDKLWSDDEQDHPGHLIWWEGLTSSAVMADYRRFMRDLIRLRGSQPALRGEGVRVSRVNNFDRVIVVHRWVADGSAGRDVVIVTSFDENPKIGYAIGLPQGGRWAELFNSDFYDRFPNPTVIGNGGAVTADGPGLDGFAHSARITIPPNGALMLTRDGHL
ncbi:MAG: alpha amylase C-terminal domain-containing protein [Alphaproteobacteria bacterium]|nr:alpha amylase C-terminal domain-containing protein [Alphaproteobacteria bacterium]